MQIAGQLIQLLLGQIQAHQNIELAAELLIELIEQVHPVIDQALQAVAQLRFLLIVQFAVLGQLEIPVFQFLQGLADIELGQARLGDLFVQTFPGFELRQAFLLLVKNARQKQAAVEHLDLVVDGAGERAGTVQLGLRADHLADQVVHIAGGVLELFAHRLVALPRAFQQWITHQAFRQVELVVTDFRAEGLAPALVDHRLQHIQPCLDHLGLRFQHPFAKTGQLFQSAGHRQLLVAQLDARFQRRQLRAQPGSLGVGKGFVFLIQAPADLVGAGQAVADRALGTLGQGLRAGQLAAHLGQGLLIFFQRFQLLAEFLGQRRQGQALVAGAPVQLGVLAGLGQLLLKAVALHRGLALTVGKRVDLLPVAVDLAPQLQGLLQLFAFGVLAGAVGGGAVAGFATVTGELFLQVADAGQREGTGLRLGHRHRQQREQQSQR